MVFRVVIGEVQDTSVPIDLELAEGDTILNPEIAHGHGFGTARFDGAVGEASGSGIVDLDGSRKLRETEFVQSSTEGSGFATVVVETTEFGFRRRRRRLL
jgi:hypothetical protein